jgi:hypothetical protein
MVGFPPEDVVKRAISLLNCEVSRLRLKAADWRSMGPSSSADLLDSDAAEYEQVRDYLEQFVTRDAGGSP